MLNVYVGVLQETCDYCRKSTDEEMVYLGVTARSWVERQSICVHTRCLMKQIEKSRSKSSAPHAEKAKEEGS